MSPERNRVGPFLFGHCMGCSKDDLFQKSRTCAAVFYPDRAFLRVEIDIEIEARALTFAVFLEAKLAALKIKQKDQGERFRHGSECNQRLAKHPPAVQGE